MRRPLQQPPGALQGLLRRVQVIPAPGQVSQYEQGQGRRAVAGRQRVVREVLAPLQQGLMVV